LSGFTLANAARLIPHLDQPANVKLSDLAYCISWTVVLRRSFFRAILVPRLHLEAYDIPTLKSLRGFHFLL